MESTVTLADLVGRRWSLKSDSAEVSPVEQDCVADQPEMLTKFVTQALFPDLTPEKGDPTKLNQDLIVTKKDELEAAEWWKHR